MSKTERIKEDIVLIQMIIERFEKEEGGGVLREFVARRFCLEAGENWGAADRAIKEAIADDAVIQIGNWLCLLEDHEYISHSIPGETHG